MNLDLVRSGDVLSERFGAEPAALMHNLLFASGLLAV